MKSEVHPNRDRILSKDLFRPKMFCVLSDVTNVLVVV